MVKLTEQDVMKELKAVLTPYVFRSFLISIVTSLLVLTPSLYMLEVYGRVLNSRSYMTLLMLTVLVIGLYVLLEVLEWVRSVHMQEGAVELDVSLRKRVFFAVFDARLRRTPAGSIQAFNDVKIIRDILPSAAFLSLLDAPLALITLVLLFIINPLIGWFAVGGFIVQLLIAVLNERSIHEDLSEASRNAMASRQYADGAVRNAQVIESMAMFQGIHDRWHSIHQDFLRQQAVASDHASSYSVLSKMVQMVVGALLLGVGGWLAIHGYISGGLVIVGSILGTRVLAPLVQLISGWRSLEAGNTSLHRLASLLAEFPERVPSMPLPAPGGRLSVDGLVAAPPGWSVPLIKGISFLVPEGGSLAIVGPTAVGKSTLLRILVGVQSFLQGSVRLDGVDLHAWNKDELGPYVGYLPQEVELFEGTLGENIARFGDMDREKLSEACRRVGLVSMIEELPDGFDTQIGPDGLFLSGGVRQRVGLARAIYGSPRFVVLDEPDSSLDGAGDMFLAKLIAQLSMEEVTLVVVSQRKSIIDQMDRVMIMDRGMVKMISPHADAEVVPGTGVPGPGQVDKGVTS